MCAEQDEYILDWRMWRCGEMCDRPEMRDRRTTPNEQKQRREWGLFRLLTTSIRPWSMHRYLPFTWCSSCKNYLGPYWRAHFDYDVFRVRLYGLKPVPFKDRTVVNFCVAEGAGTFCLCSPAKGPALKRRIDVRDSFPEC